MLLLLVLLAAAASPLILGLLLGLLVRLGPGREWKVKLARKLAHAQAWASGEDEDGKLLAALEMEWMMRRRYCKEPWMGQLYDEIYKRSRNGTAHHLSPEAVHKAMKQ